MTGTAGTFPNYCTTRLTSRATGNPAWSATHHRDFSCIELAFEFCGIEIPTKPGQKNTKAANAEKQRDYDINQYLYLSSAANCICLLVNLLVCKLAFIIANINSKTNMLNKIKNIFRHFKNYFWLSKPTLQEYFFKLALKEVGIYWGVVKVDHYEGRSWHKKTGWVPLIFPKKMVKCISEHKINKTCDYYFKGVVSDSRKWIKKYDNVNPSSYGRIKSKKYKLDTDYYNNLRSARFGLSPIGECPWSYRFFESIMCHAVPVIGDEELDIYAKDFHYLRDSSSHEYNFELCLNNLKILKHNHTLDKYISKK